LNPFLLGHLSVEVASVSRIGFPADLILFLGCWQMCFTLLTYYLDCLLMMMRAFATSFLNESR